MTPPGGTARTDGTDRAPGFGADAGGGPPRTEESVQEGTTVGEGHSDYRHVRDERSSINRFLDQGRRAPEGMGFVKPMPCRDGVGAAGHHDRPPARGTRPRIGPRHDPPGESPRDFPRESGDLGESGSRHGGLATGSGFGTLDLPTADRSREGGNPPTPVAAPGTRSVGRHASRSAGPGRVRAPGDGVGDGGVDDARGSGPYRCGASSGCSGTPARSGRSILDANAAQPGLGRRRSRTSSAGEASSRRRS